MKVFLHRHTLCAVSTLV